MTGRSEDTFVGLWPVDGAQGVRLGVTCSPLDLTVDEARTLAGDLLEAADLADTTDRSPVSWDAVPPAAIPFGVSSTDFAAALAAANPTAGAPAEPAPLACEFDGQTFTDPLALVGHTFAEHGPSLADRVLFQQANAVAARL